MADVVRTGAIFRVKNASSMRSPMPRLPMARGRITSATPETPAGKRSGRSALESVVPRGTGMPPPHPPTHNKTKRTGQASPEAEMLETFNRLVTESETRRAAKRLGVRKPTVEKARDDEVSSPETPEATRKGRKRPRTEPDEEPTEEEEEEEEEDASSEEMVTPQPRRYRQTSSEDDDSDDGVQKRLVYDDTPPAKPKKPIEMKHPVTKKTRPPPKSKQAKATPKKIAVAAGGLEFMSMSVASTPSRSTRIRTGVLVMSEWYVDWPPVFVGDQLQLVINGQVLGQPSTFTVQRRVTDMQFISTDNQNVRLSGCLDIGRAQQADVPPVVMELLVEGIPTNWRQLLESYAPPPDPWIPLSVKSKEKAKQRKAKAAEAERKKSITIPGVTPSKSSKVAAATPIARTPVTPNVEKRSRSGRRLTPVMEWWRNERKVVDTNFETKIVEGSPSYLPSNRIVEMSDAAKAARKKIQEIYDAQRKSAEWSEAQLAALQEAKVQVPTTHANFWGEVAKLVPGKSADECRARSFDDLPAAPTRKSGGGGSKGTTTKQPSQVPVKIHRAGSNAFKKQVRKFVHDQEQKNVDDLFSSGTPSKDAIAGTFGLDDLKSPGAPSVESRSREDNDSDDDLFGGAGRELLEKVSMSKRDDVDSYVRTLKRGNDSLGLKAVRTSKATAAEFTTPPTKKKPRREGVHMTTEVGAHKIEAIVTPNGTTRVRVERGSDDEDILDEDEDEDEEAQLSDSF